MPKPHAPVTRPFAPIGNELVAQIGTNRFRYAVAPGEDLYAAAAPRWVQRERLDRVSAMNVLYYQGGRWLAWPSDQPAHPGRGVRLELQRDGAPYVCTFALPWGRS